MERDILYKISQENFHFLMDCINAYWDRTAPPRNGLLYFIKDSLIAERVITKYQPTKMEYFKAFFCNVVLDLHNGGAELNIKEYEEYFGNQQGKQYAIFPEKMNLYLNRQENIEYMRQHFEAVELQDGEKVVPVLLLSRLQEVAHQCLKEYFLLDEDAFLKAKWIRIEGKKIETYEQAKRKLYRRFICAACLYEIFTIQFLGDAMGEEVYFSLKELQEKTEAFITFQKELNQEIGPYTAKENKPEITEEIAKDLISLMNHGKEICMEVNSMMLKMNNAMGRIYFYMIHSRYIIALYAVISMVEFTNVNTKDDIELPRKLKRLDLYYRMEELFMGSGCESLFIENISMNKNYSAVYQKVMEAVAEETIIQELCSKSENTQQEALSLLYMYFSGVLTGARLEDEDFVTALKFIAQKSMGEAKKEESVL